MTTLFFRKHSRYRPPNPSTVRIHLSGNVSTEKTISTNDEISTLMEFANNGDSRFVYNGMILNPALSFAFYGITENDTIYVVTPENHHKLVSVGTQAVPDMTAQLRSHFDKHWGHRLSDPDTAFQKFKDAYDPITARENARLIDLHRTKIESSTIGYRRLCSKFRNAQEMKMQKIGSEAIQKEEEPKKASTNF